MTVQSNGWHDLLAAIAGSCACPISGMAPHRLTTAVFLPATELWTPGKEGDDGPCPLFHPYFAQLEVEGGFLFTFKVGFNVGEFADFILGWFGIDFFDDDMSRRKAKRKSEAESRKSLLDW